MAEEPRALRWAMLGVALGVAALAVLMFSRTGDPMLLVFGGLAATLAALAMVPRGWYPHSWHPGPPPGAVVRVRCASCRALNLEEARFCGQCGKPM